MLHVEVAFTGQSLGVFPANACGTTKVLEAARLFDAERAVFTSSLTTHGLSAPQVVKDETISLPTAFYGCGKVYCELVGRFYRTKFNLDFRKFRSPTSVGSVVKTPAVMQDIPLILENAALGKPYESYVVRQTESAGFMHFKDSVRAVDMLYRAKKENTDKR